MRPTLVLQTVCFDDSDRKDAQHLGADLYRHLTRPLEDRLAHGAGIPVFSAVSDEVVETGVAETLVLVPVLGSQTFAKIKGRVVECLEKWDGLLGDGHVIPAPTASCWRDGEDRLPGHQLLTELYAKDDPRQRTLDEIVLATGRLFESAGDRGRRIRIFVSHAKADLASTEEAAKKIHDFVVTDTTGQAFLDAVDLHPGHSLGDDLDAALGYGVFVAVRGDAYSSRSWCQKELLRAKQNGLPALTVEVLRKGEARSSAYAGNSPSMVWDGRPEPIVSRALVEWLRAAAFQDEAKRVVRLAPHVEKPVVLCRPPELLDLAQGPLASGTVQTAIHPDPELPAVEREVLRLANPGLSVLTPTTVFRCIEEGDSKVESPLDGIQVALSLSESPDVNGDDGLTEHHVDDATVYLARSLVSAGAAIAYGGDFRRNGYTQLLSDLIAAYNQTATERAELLHSYLGVPIELSDAPGDLKYTAHHLGSEPFDASAALPPAEGRKFSETEAALYFSDMRRAMAKATDARVVLGGQAVPRVEGGSGYGGRYPGVVEEAWRTLREGKPLYVAGGFGGAAGLVADLLLEKSTPDRLRDERWAGAEFEERADAIDRHEWRKRLELPRSMEDMADAIREHGLPFLASHDSSRAWNGLNVDENRELFTTRDPVTMTSLVLRGLMAVVEKAAANDLRIELVQGDIMRARDLDAVGVAAFDRVPLGGAAAEFDRALGGRVLHAHEQGDGAVDMGTSDLAPNMLYVASLGSLDDLEHLPDRIEAASRKTAELVGARGVKRLGVVAFGGSVVQDVEHAVRAMTRGLRELPRTTTVRWFETDSGRCAAIKRQLRAEPGVRVTTHKPPIEQRVTERGAELMLRVVLEGDTLSTVTLPPSGTGIALDFSKQLEEGQLEDLSSGGGLHGRETPDLRDLERRGETLAELLFGANAPQLLDRCREAKVVVVHDVPSSRLPFELLFAKAEGQAAVRPATTGGVNRRLAVEGAPLEHLLGKTPRTGKLRVLLVVNPTEDLPSTEVEGRAVREEMESQPHVELNVLRGKEATRDAVLEAMKEADVLHYSGHAFYLGPGDSESGLILADEKLTLEQVCEHEFPVRLAFVNACEAGRVRGEFETQAAAFAELFLRGGVEAYLGTYWLVADAAAADFAAHVYSDLANGETLDVAVRRGRAKLFAAGEADWANYLLYGDGRFRLVTTREPREHA